MESKQAPSEDQQYAIYRKVAEHMKGKTVILRLLDIGGDKPLSYLNFPKEENLSLAGVASASTKTTPKSS